MADTKTGKPVRLPNSRKTNAPRAILIELGKSKMVMYTYDNYLLSILRRTEEPILLYHNTKERDPDKMLSIALLK
jgi:hypothetical protein